MVALRLDEKIVNLAMSKLQANMPKRVAAINNEMADQIFISPPTDDNYFRSGVTSMPLAPAIVVVPGRTDFESQFEGPHSFVTLTELLVYVLEQDQDRQTLGSRLMRQSRAIIESLWDEAPTEKLDSNAYRIFPSYTVPGAVFEPSADDSWRGFYLVVFHVTQLEE